METYHMLIGGEWRAATGGRTRPVLNPATGKSFAEVPEGTREDAYAALQQATAAQPAWEARTGVQRAAYLKRIAELITAQSERLARLILQSRGSRSSKHGAKLEVRPAFSTTLPPLPVQT
ncbi:MAG: hypothetical protein NVS2B7_34530 [Herpetosiphon sp.]